MSQRPDKKSARAILTASSPGKRSSENAQATQPMLASESAAAASNINSRAALRTSKKVAAGTASAERGVPLQQPQLQGNQRTGPSGLADDSLGQPPTRSQQDEVFRNQRRQVRIERQSFLLVDACCISKHRYRANTS